MVRTTSTSFISGTGLKKCRPSTCPGRLVAAAMAVTLHEEVLDARSVWGRQMASSLAKVSFFSGWFSVMASMTRSQSLRSSRCVEPRSRLAVSSLARASIFALATRLSRLFWIPPRPLSRRAWFASITMVEKPACADTWAMPEPISPQPITPTCLMAMLERPPWTIYRWWRDVTAGLRGRDASEASTPLLVSDQGLDAVTLQALPPLQEGQLDEEVAGDHNPSEPLDQAERGGHGAAGREQVVHDEHALAAADGVLVDGEHVTAVFELVLLLDHRARELALLPHGHETRAQLLRQRAAEDEAA